MRDARCDIRARASSAAIVRPISTCTLDDPLTTPPRAPITHNMWGLDRISGHSTPLGGTPPRRESFSPAPRRPYPSGPGPLPVRPGLNPRSSSLSLVSPLSSTSSLPQTANIPNGSGRRRPPGSVPLNVPDPLQVLEQIMGGPPRKPVAVQAGGIGVLPDKPEELDTDIDFEGLSLQDFAAAEVHRPVTSLVHTYSAQSVEECMSLESTPECLGLS